MTPPSLIHRVIFFLALLPQLLVLGLGHGVVVCVGPGGHVEIETVGGICCSDSEAAPSSSEVDGFQHSDSDCGPCTDIALLSNSKHPSDRDADDLDQSLESVGRPVATHVILGAQDPAHFFVRPVERHCEPPHLDNLRSVLLRC